VLFVTQLVGGTYSRHGGWDWTVMPGDTGRTRLYGGPRRRWQDITKMVLIGVLCDAEGTDEIHPAR